MKSLFGATSPQSSRNQTKLYPRLTYSSRRDSGFTQLNPTKSGATKSHLTGFTLIELLVVIAIISILATMVLAVMPQIREDAKLSRARQEFRSFYHSVLLYMGDHGDYPPDVNRGIPPGLEEYLESGDWPSGPWPESEYDWENWVVEGEPTRQISIRFCKEYGNPDSCNYPSADWAEDFDTESAIYFCIEGLCRSHEAKPASYPGHCVNCGEVE